MSNVEVDFSQYVVSVARGVMTGLGELPDPDTLNTATNLELAKHGISVLRMLSQKTAGNLSDDEKKLIETLLADLGTKLDSKSS
jgi:hypothetical protein